MSNRDSVSPMSDVELDALLEAADEDLTARLERATDTTAGSHTIIAGETVSMSDVELDAALKAADEDLAAGLERATDPADGGRAIVSISYIEARKIHPAVYSGLADGA